MARVFSVALSSLLIYLVLIMPDLKGQHCALVVKIVDPSNQPIDTYVTVMDSAGSATEQKATNGAANFCGLGIKPVTVTVGRNERCNQLIVKNVPLRWGRTYVMKVIYDYESCLSPWIPVVTPSCEMLVKTIDADGDPVAGAVLRLRGRAAELKTDDYGRAYLNLAVGMEAAIDVRHPDYSSTSIHTACLGPELKVEKTVVLAMPPLK